MSHAFARLLIASMPSVAMAQLSDWPRRNAKVTLWFEPSGRLCATLREGDPAPVRYVRRKS